MKPLAAVATTGIFAFILFKLFVGFVLPLFGVAIVAVLVVLKVLFWIGVVWFLVWLFRRMSRSESTAS